MATIYNKACFVTLFAQKQTNFMQKQTSKI